MFQGNVITLKRYDVGVSGSHIWTRDTRLMITLRFGGDIFVDRS